MSSYKAGYLIFLFTVITVFTACSGTKNLSEVDLNPLESTVESVDSNPSHYLLTLTGFSDVEALQYKASINRLNRNPVDVLEIIENEGLQTLTVKINHHPLSLNRVLWSLGAQHYRDHSIEHQFEVPETGFVIISDMPKLIGGKSELQKKVQYPEDLEGSGVSGEVLIKFVVNKFGETEDLHLVKGIHELADQEAIRVVSEAQFRPGIQEGVPIRVQIELSILFRE